MINPITIVFKIGASINIEAPPRIQREIAWASELLEIKIEKSFLFKRSHWLSKFGRWKRIEENF
tara:strand:+ start:337 stop:528 length:192 start_codon:yes stop_codon:yes gene_type:complete